MEAVMGKEPPAELVVLFDRTAGVLKAPTHGEQGRYRLTQPDAGVGVADPSFEFERSHSYRKSVPVSPGGELPEPSHVVRVDPKRWVAEVPGQFFGLLHSPRRPILLPEAEGYQRPGPSVTARFRQLEGAIDPSLNQIPIGEASPHPRPARRLEGQLGVQLPEHPGI